MPITKRNIYVEQEVETVEKVTCDLCKRELTQEQIKNNEYQPIKRIGREKGYYPPNNKVLDTVICEYCLEDIFGDIVELKDVVYPF